MVCKDERKTHEAKNVATLKAWDGGAGLAENVRVLASVLKDLLDLTDDAGRHTKLLRDFEHWFSWSNYVLKARAEQKDERLEFVEGLGDAWKMESEALMRKLAVLKRDVEALVAPDKGSTVAAVLDSCRCLLEDALEEVRTIWGIEQEVVDKEARWVEERLRAVTGDMHAV